MENVRRRVFGCWGQIGTLFVVCLGLTSRKIFCALWGVSTVPAVFVPLRLLYSTRSTRIPLYCVVRLHHRTYLRTMYFSCNPDTLFYYYYYFSCNPFWFLLTQYLKSEINYDCVVRTKWTTLFTWYDYILQLLHPLTYTPYPLRDMI